MKTQCGKIDKLSLEAGENRALRAAESLHCKNFCVKVKKVLDRGKERWYNRKASEEAACKGRTGYAERQGRTALFRNRSLKIKQYQMRMNTTQNSLGTKNSKEGSVSEKRWVSLRDFWRRLQKAKESNSGTKFSDGNIARFGMSISLREQVDIKDLTKSLILAQDERWRRA